MKCEGVARHIGVSNFTPALIDEAVRHATEPLVNDQIELHPYLDQSKTIAASRKAGMSVTAYSPIARGRVKGDALLSRIGKAHGKSAAQVCLRYLVQQELIVIPKTSRTERLKENIAIFDFTLTPAEVKEIAALASPRRPHRRVGRCAAVGLGAEAQRQSVESRARRNPTTTVSPAATGQASVIVPVVTISPAASGRNCG